MDKFVNILNKPDYVWGATEASPFRFEEEPAHCAVNFEYRICGKSAKIIIYPNGSPVKFLKLRFMRDMPFIDRVFGDNWERSGSGAYLEWRSVMPHRGLPNFCYVQGNNRTACYGVKTGADCFAFFQVDTHGVTLFLNLTNGNDGTDLKEPLTACEVVQLLGEENESAFSTASRFSKVMCSNPILPAQPIFGVNNWYWTYGKITNESIMSETDYLMQMTSGTKNRPYMIIDDGWQKNRTFGTDSYIGGEWLPNSGFNSMETTAEKIHAKGAKAGLWLRPLLTRDEVLGEARLGNESNGIVLDPSHPFTLDKVSKDVKRIRSWGYDLIKHDFTTFDMFGIAPLTAEQHNYRLTKNRNFFDKTKTNATIIKNLYKQIQNAAGGADVIGCNVISHLAAGIHSVVRTGNDTSGRSFEWTFRHGTNTMLRLPLNDSFYKLGPDCAVFTDRVDTKSNMDFLRMCALTGVTSLASVIPFSLSEKELLQINEIFKIADRDSERYTIGDFETNSCPEVFISADGRSIERIDWTGVYKGSRTVLDWSI